MQAVIFALAVLRASSDLPVHCVRHQVIGEWRFTLGPESDQRSSCGHQRPDVETAQPSRESLAWHEKATNLMVTLKAPNQAETARDSRGLWTMIYDEGFEVRVGGLNFFAFSNFTFEHDDAHKKLSHNVSHCGDTMVGWYQNFDRTKFGCYYGSKVLQEHPVHHQVHSPKSKSSVYDAPLDHKTQHKIVNKINMMQLGWKARSMHRWNGKTWRDLNTYAGIKRTHTMDSRREMLRQRVQPKHERIFLQRSAADLPTIFDWSNASGINFLEPVMDQEECGSCYAASSMRMLTTRHKIKLNDTNAVPWSINFPLFCSEYNQGCKGGYGILTAKWSRDVGLLPATCMRYNTAGSCKLECDLKNLPGKRYRADNHRYVGSFYGNSSVDSIKRELMQGGPLVLGLEPAEDFMFYSDGVYRSAAKVKKNKLHLPGQEWEKVDHAVLLVGWGVDGAEHYWRIQNSWGPDWGEDGFFRITMNENESGIESIPEAADVVEDEQNGKQVEAFFDQFQAKVVQRHST